MKIRRSILWGCIGAVVVLMLVIWFARRPTNTPVEIITAPDATEPAPGQSRQQIPSSSRTNAQTVTPGAPATSVSPPPSTNNKVERMREVLSSLNDMPIVFYGKVEDQFGNPVAGAEITGHTIIYNGVTAGIDRYSTTSDAAGFFRLNAGKGESLGVAPRKQGYALATTATEFKYSQLYEGHHVPNPNDPVVMKMWKLQGVEPLLRISQRHKFQYAGKPVNFDLLTGKIVPTGGDIRITVNRSPGILSSRDRQDWGVKIEAVNGGIMDSSGQEAVTYWAPESDYQSSIALTFSTNAPYKWFDGFTQGFFVKSRDGQVYSKLGISFGINYSPDEPMDITLSGVVNTNGSRNWEGDPNTAKTIGQ